MSRLQQFLRRLFPRPHRRLGLTSAWPLGAFAVLFALVAFAIIPTPVFTAASPQRWSAPGFPRLPFLTRLNVAFPQPELVRELEFASPWMLLLLILAPWIWWMQAAGHAGLPPRRGAWAGLIRLLLFGLLILVLAEPRAVRTSDRVSVVYNVDVSDSVRPWRNEALEFVAQTAAEKPAADEAGLVVFGRTPAVEYPPRSTFPFERFINSQVAADATNLEQSLALSAAMLPEDNLGRIVLVSDGTETVGQLRDVVDDLQSRGIEVSVVPMDYQYDSEVLLERLDLPRLVRLGETYEASVVLNSLKPSSGTLVFSDGDNVISREEITFPAGKTRFSIPIKVDQPGYYEYSARIEPSPGSDSRSENNEVRNYIYLDGPGRILIVTDTSSSTEEVRFLELALKQGERQVDVMTAGQLPFDPLQLMPYDAIIFADVPADALLATQIQAVHDAIRDLGIGFLMVGGPNSFGPGGWQGSPIASALPISLEITNKKILPKGAVAIILHTCEFPAGNAWAKRITKRAIQVLNPEDLVGVLAQTASGDGWIFDLTPASEYPTMVPKINNAQIGDMGTFSTTMQLGYDSLAASDAASRHMIIISDGDPQAPPPELLQKFVDSQISVSTVAVFPHNGDTQLMADIASITKGRLYVPSDPSELPSIFVKEAKTLRRSQIQTRSFTPQLVGTDPLLRGITQSPQLHGYVLTSPKDDPRASILLSAPLTDSEKAAGEEDPDPILAVWRYGLGVTAAWTSDFTERWGRDYVQWNQFQQLVNQIVTRIGRSRREQFLRVYTYVNGNDGVVVVEDFHPEETLLDVNVSVKGPGDFEKSQPVRQIAPRRYQTTLALQGEGRYQVMVSATDGTRNESANAGFIVSYSPEYLRFRANPLALREIAESTGGKELDIDADAASVSQQLFGERQPKRSSRPIFDWYLMLIALLLPVDVAVRRVQLDGSWIKRLFRREKSSSGKTLGTLLQRTGEVRSTLAGMRGAGNTSAADTPRPATPQKPPAWLNTPPASSSADHATPTQTPSAPAPDNAPSQPSTEDAGTTSRLLALKKKRDQPGK
ncbi:MAG: VWA domain-containing protein [Planctomycetaceae bacterium]